jgi:cell division protein FtsQ
VDRSFAARAPIGRLARPLSFALPRGAIVKRLCIALVALALLAGGWLLLRSSPLVSIEHVRITGVQGLDAGPIDAALRGAARGMSTLNVNVGALRAAVASFPVVRDLSVRTSFPHGLRIHVVEQPPVAVLTIGAAHTAVAADGVVLGPGLLSSSLPTVTLAGALLPRAGSHVQNTTVRAELSLLGAAPRALLGWVARVFLSSREGLTMTMRNGLAIYFGDATRPHAKWLSAVRVLADPSSAGATYVDVRAPERPAAGTTSASGLESAVTPAQVSASDPTSAAIANALAEAVSGGPSAAASAPAMGAAGSGAEAAEGLGATATGATGSGATGSSTEAAAPSPSSTEAAAPSSSAAGSSPEGSSTPGAGATGSATASAGPESTLPQP